jgi:uncharacterized protein YcfJ
MFSTKLIRILSIFALCSLGGCSFASYASQEALTGALGGTAVGSAVGWVIGQEVGDTAQNVAVNAAIGTGVGILAGAALNERNIRAAQKKEVVVREARLISKNQKELDELREEIYDSSSWGRNEVQSWDQRYTGDYPSVPYQGSTLYNSPKQ